MRGRNQREKKKKTAERGRKKDTRKGEGEKTGKKREKAWWKRRGESKRRSPELPQFVFQSGSLKTILKKSKSISHSSKMVSTNRDMEVFCFGTLVAHNNSEQPPPPAFDEAQQYFSSTHFYFLLFIIFGVLL